MTNNQSWEKNNTLNKLNENIYDIIFKRKDVSALYQRLLKDIGPEDLCAEIASFIGEEKLKEALDYLAGIHY